MEIRQDRQTKSSQDAKKRVQSSPIQFKILVQTGDVFWGEAILLGKAGYSHRIAYSALQRTVMGAILSYLSGGPPELTQHSGRALVDLRYRIDFPSSSLATPNSLSP